MTDDGLLRKYLDPEYVEKEPAQRKRLKFKGDQCAEAKKRWYFGPTHDPAGGAGKFWRYASAEYDADADQTVVWLAPVSDLEIQAVAEEIHKRRMAQG